MCQQTIPFFYQSPLKKTFTLTWLLSCLLMLNSACQPYNNPLSNSADEHIDKHSPTQISENQLCQKHQKPFAFSLCQIPNQPQAKDGIKLQLFWKNQQNQPLLTFKNLQKQLPKQQLAFAMNAGMYNQEFAPIGYTVIDGKQILSLNLNKGRGNFHLLPNGVFWWDEQGFHVTESHAMQQLLAKKQANPKFATQSGPMLVINGEIHPKFNSDSVSKKFRNGVGVCQDDMVRFIISDEPVNFYQFADLFKSQFHCNNALFLDGGIASALYTPELHRKDGQNMGVMIGASIER